MTKLEVESRMIAHVSIPARDPKSTARLLANLIGGQAFPFPIVPGAFIAVASDRSGTAFEVYPDAMAHHPGKGDVDPTVRPEGPQTMPWEDQIFPDGPQLRPAAFHCAITSPHTEDQVLAIAKAAGLRAVRCERAGVFGLVEVWIDGLLLIEVLSGSEVERYRAFMNTESVVAMFGSALAEGSR